MQYLGTFGVEGGNLIEDLFRRAMNGRLITVGILYRKIEGVLVDVSQLH